MREKLLIIGNIGSGKSTLARGLAARLGVAQLGIDECRHAIGDGTVAREAAAWAHFLEQAENSAPLILDCSGTGPMAHLVRYALARCGLPVRIVYLHVPVETCAQRVAGRAWSTPYPNFNVPLEKVLQDVAANLAREAREPSLWPAPIIELDGQKPAEALQALVLEHLDLTQNLTPAPAQPIAKQRTLKDIADHLLRWAEANPSVEALFFYGAFARGRIQPDSDLDAALLIDANDTISPVLTSLERTFADETRHRSQPSSDQLVLWLGSAHRKLDLRACHKTAELMWIAEARDVAAPRLTLAFARSSAGIDDLLTVANRDVIWTPQELRERADFEVDKFLVSIDASARASQRDDAYAAYFQYNLALHQLVRLIQLARGGARHLYLPQQLISRHLTAAESTTFRTLAARLDLPSLNVQRQRMFQFFLNLLPELNSQLATTKTAAQLSHLAKMFGVDSGDGQQYG